MKIKTTQRGMTFWGVMVIAFIAGCFALLAIRLVPIYIDDLKVSSALDALIHNAKNQSRNTVIQQFMQQLTVNDITSIQSDDLKLEPRGSGFSATLDYEIRITIVYNVDAVVTFSHHRDLP